MKGRNFRVSCSSGSAEALVRYGGKIKYILIAYFLGNVYAKNCRNRTVYVKIIASCKGGTFFETQCSLRCLYFKVTVNKMREHFWTSSICSTHRLLLLVPSAGPTVWNMFSNNRYNPVSTEYENASESFSADSRSAGRGSLVVGQNKCVRVRLVMGVTHWLMTH